MSFRLSALLSIAALTAPAGPASAQTFDDAVQAGEALDRIGRLSDAPHPTCGTMDVRTVQAGWEALDDGLRARADALLPGAFGAEGGSGASAPRGNVSCDLRLANALESDHFSVEWGPAVSLPEATAQYLLDALEVVRGRFLAAGYPEPAGNPDQKIPFYFGNSGGGSPSIGFDGGYTTMCSGSEHAYVVMSSMRDDPGSVELATHELFHAVQMGGPASGGVDRWYWEASATWSEDLVEPDWNTYAWVLGAYTSATDLPLADESSFLHRYGLFIFVSFLAEHAPGGLDLARHVWTTSNGGDLADRLEEFWEGIDDRTDFAEQFAHFTARTAVMDYVDHAVFMNARVPPRDVPSPPTVLADVSGAGLYGSHFYRVDPTDANGRTKLRVHFEGADDRDWLVAFARSPDGRSVVSTQMYLDRWGEETVELLDIGTTYEETWIIVTRIDEDPSSYTLDLEWWAQTEPPGSDLIDDDDGRRRDALGSACGASHPFAWPTLTASLAAGESGWSLLLLLPLLALLRRAPRSPR